MKGYYTMLAFLKNANGEGGGQKKLWLILIVAAVGIALIFLGGITEEEDEASSSAQISTDYERTEEYRAYLEKEIKTLCESVGGIRDVTVALTLSGGFESVYATEWKEGGEEYVIVGNGTSAKPLYLTSHPPSITGIGIVCHGAEADHVKYELIALLAATYHISTNRIYIANA